MNSLERYKIYFEHHEPPDFFKLIGQRLRRLDKARATRKAQKH